MVLARARLLALRLRHLVKPRTQVRRYLASRMRTRHNVAVRFSLRLRADWSQQAHGDEAGRARWFAMRAALFRATAAASLVRQTRPPDRVFVLMHTGDEPLWREHLHLPSPFVPVFVAADRAADVLAQHVREDGIRHVVVSRLDSDDLVGPTYLENLDRTVRDARRAGRTLTFVVACTGWVTDLVGLQSIHYTCSPFISLYADRYAGEDVYGVEHERILEQDPLLNLTSPWMQVVHGTNIANRLRTRSRFRPGDRRTMRLGPIQPVEESWPAQFPRELLAGARRARAAYSDGRPDEGHRSGGR